MADLANTFEGGSNTTNLTAGSGGNTGGLSGNFFGTVAKSGTATSRFTTADKVHGFLAWEGVAASGEFDYLEWTTQLGAATDRYYRFYFKTSDETPTTSFAIFRLNNGASLAGDVQLRTDGTLALRDQSATARYFTSAVSPNTWYRIEVHYVHSTTVGHMEIRVYDVVDSTGTPWSTAGNLIDNWNTLAQSDGVRFGIGSNPGQTITVRLDDIATSTAGWLGPVVETNRGIGGNLAVAGPVTMTVAESSSYPAGQLYYIDDSLSMYAVTSKALVNGQAYDFKAFTLSYVGWTAATPAFVVDLLEAFSGVWVVQGYYGSDGIARPTRAQLEYSDDNSSWTVVANRTGLTAGGAPGGRGWLQSWDASALSHRYWRFTFTNPGTWLFISDVRLV